MKHLLHTIGALVLVLALGSCAAPSGGSSGSGSTQLGPHSGRNFKIIRLKPGQVASDMLDHAMAIVLTVEQKMEGGKQVITMSASSRLDGPDGRLEPVARIGIRMSEPMKYQTDPNPKPAAEAHSTQSVTASGGKYKTVTAEAFMTSDKFQDTSVTVTIPGDK
jgi:hypothetical protein